MNRDTHRVVPTELRPSVEYAGLCHQHRRHHGFCGETQEEHEATLSLMDEVRYDMAFMFKYSERPKTLAERKFEDDVPEDGRRTPKR